MIKLTDTQMNVLVSACRRPDGIAIRPAALNRTAAVKVAAKLIEQVLVQEAPAKLDAPVWRMDEEGRAFSLKITKAGRAIVRSAGAKDAAPVIKPLAKPIVPNIGVEPAQQARHASPLVIGGQAKTGSKRTIILALMQRTEGATIDDLVAATGWLPHTTRAALTMLRKSGVAITRTRDPEDVASVYRIARAVVSAAA